MVHSFMVKDPNLPLNSTNANTIFVGEKPKSISFSGCGFLGFYHVGVASCLKMHAPGWLKNVEKIYGCSGGSLVGAMLLGDVRFEEVCQRLMNIVKDLRSRYLGPFSPGFKLNEMLMRDIEDGLPEDAHILATGKLYISLTRFRDGKNVIVSDYKTRDELVQVLLSSCFIPFYSGIFPPKYRGVRYVDGGLSNNLPAFHDTITVSPWSGNSDICPRNDQAESVIDLSFVNTSIQMTASNLYRCSTMFFPPNPEVLKELCCQGFRETIQYLRNHGLFETVHPLRKNLSFSALLHEVEERRKVTRRMSFKARCMHEQDFQLNGQCTPDPGHESSPAINAFTEKSLKTPFQECFESWDTVETYVPVPISTGVYEKSRNVFIVVQVYPILVEDHIIRNQFSLPLPILDALDSPLNCNRRSSWSRSLSRLVAVCPRSNLFQISFEKTYSAACFFLAHSTSFSSDFAWMLNRLQWVVSQIHMRFKCSGQVLLQRLGHMEVKAQKEIANLAHEMNAEVQLIIKAIFKRSMPIYSTLLTLLHMKSSYETNGACVNDNTNRLTKVV